MQFPVSVNLKRPIRDAETDAVITALVFDEPDIGLSIDVEEAETGRDQMLILLSGMAGISVATFKRIREGDYIAIRRDVLDPYTDMQTARAAEEGEAGNAEAAE